ncbi:MAG TPA: hypothetical protein VK155_00320 [Bacteroidales bacterium]|nr:hypothetical protein [Bacteroidales bacterium]
MKSASSQYYNTGQDPASAKWLRIKTRSFDVIYPSSFGQSGIDFAKSLEKSAAELTGFFPERNYRVPVVIHSLSTVSNGYVAWAPKRMEIYPAPEQDALPGDQYGLLTVHELTHVNEMNLLHSGFSGFMSYLLGEQFTGVISALLPQWYLEGHAVVSETAFTSSGRGRSPFFMKDFRALTTSAGRYYNYDKIILGSFRNYVPDHYRSGYQMVAWSMAGNGNDLWNKVLKFTADEPFTINPVNISLYRNARLTKKRLYRQTFDSLRTIWNEELRNRPAYDVINPAKRETYVNYYSPVPAGKDSVIAIRTSLSSTSAIVLINTGTKKEKVLIRTGLMSPYLLSYGAGKIVWTEGRPDPRWDNRNYSVIREYNLWAGTAKNLTSKSRYLSSSVSPDGKTVAAVENTSDNKNNLVLLDAASGEVLKVIPSESNRYIQRPAWSADKNVITVIFLTDTGEGVMMWHTHENRWEVVLKPTNVDIRSAFMSGGLLYFVSARSGTDNIFVKTPGEGIRQITDSRYGVSDPVLAGNELLFSDYSSTGYSLSKIPVATRTATLSDTSSFLINKMTRPEPGQLKETEKYSPEPYRKWQHLFRFHSWMPFYADIDQLQSDPLAVRPGLTIMSQNSLSSLTSVFGYEYSARKKHVFHSTLTWAGWYPEVRSKIDYGYNQRVYGNPVNILPGLRFINEIDVPLRFSSGYFTQFLRPSLNIDYSNSIFPKSETVYDYGQTDLTWRLYFSNYSRAALRDIYNRWAQVIDLNYASSPFDNDILGSSFFIKTALYFPGIFRNNSIRLRYQKEVQRQSIYIFGNRISFPRGYDNIAYPEGYHNIISDDLNFASAEYVFPIIYPDLNVPPVFFLKRIRSTLFYDYAYGRKNRYYTDTPTGKRQTAYHDFYESFRSYGVELLADFHLFRIPFMISGGVQAAWKSTNKLPVLNAVFNIDLYGFSIGREK